MTMESPYIDAEYNTRVLLQPHQMMGDIYKNLKLNLIKNVKNKCNKYGYITDVYKITEYKDNILEAENFRASAVYNIKFTCRICIPIENMFIECKIKQINETKVWAHNGPMRILVELENINTSKFSINNNQQLIYNDDKKELKKNDVIKIKILVKKINKGDTNIKIIGYLDDRLDEKDISEDKLENDDEFI